MPLAGLQHQLERLYEVAPGPRVEDFLLTDRRVADGLDRHGRGSPERLLLSEEADGLALGLYIDKSVLQRLGEDDPLEALHACNLADFLTALEGVSHFLYLTWNASHRRAVSLLELELQAEIDKFVLAALLMARQQRGRVPRALGRQLFEQAHYAERLDPVQRRRYARANRYARAYCRHLERHYLQGESRPGLIPALRRFYRYTQVQKLRHIETVARH